MTDTSQNAGWRGLFAGFALALAIFGALWFFIAAGGTKLGLWDWKVGFGTLSMKWSYNFV